MTATCESLAQWTTPSPAAPPGEPASSAKPDGSVTVLAIRNLHLGDADWASMPSEDAWKLYGFDLDGFASTPYFGFHCKPSSGADPNDVMVDGPGGIDNSFGRNVMKFIEGWVDHPSDEATKSIARGVDTHVLVIEGLGAAANCIDLKATWTPARGNRDVDGNSVAPPPGDWTAYAWQPLDGLSTAFDTVYVNEGAPGRPRPVQ
jgi:hypothetical protein